MLEDRRGRYVIVGADEMRTNGGRGIEGWIAAIPLVGLIIALMMSPGDVDSKVSLLEGILRSAATSLMEFVGWLF
jgi:hypothetical protein